MASERRCSEWIRTVCGRQSANTRDTYEEDVESDPLIKRKNDSKDVQTPKRREHVFLKESLLKEFNELLKTPEKKEEFKNLLDGRDLKRLQKIHDFRKNKEDNSDNIPEWRSFLSRSCLQEVLAKMLEDVAKYAEYLKLFISHFKAYNECIEPQYVTSKADKSKKGKKSNAKPLELDSSAGPQGVTSKEDESKKEMKTIAKLRELDSPLHCAARQLDVPFLDWLLKQPVAEPTVAEGSVAVQAVSERIVVERTEDDQSAAELTVAGSTVAETIVAEPTSAERPIVERIVTETTIAEPTVVEQTLLNRIAVDVNLRNKAKETALALLCIRYDNVKQRLKQPPNRSNEQTKINEELATVKVMIEKLLAKGADFNVFTCAALPFDLLRKYYETEDEEAHDLVNNIIIPNTGAIALSGKPRNSVRFLGETTNNISVTVELLEIFVRFNDIDHFKKYWNKFVVTDCNVKSVITLLLHTAVEQARVDYVNEIIKKSKDMIFKYDEANNMDHRVELKGLLKKPCLNGDPKLLRIILSHIRDRLLLTEVPLLVTTVNKAHRAKNDMEAGFKACAKVLIDNYMKVPIHATDSDGNTALHLALKFGFEKLALLMLEKQHGLMGLRNHQNLTPVEYGTLQFWESYLDSCIKPKRPVIRINVSFLRPIEKEKRTKATPPTKVTSPTEATTQTEATPQEGAPKTVQGSRRRTWGWPDSWKILQPVKEGYNSKCLFAQTVTEMTTLRLVAQSKERKRLLLHPTLISFIMMKWMRLCHWNILNLLLTTLTMLCFGAYTLMSCSNDGYTAWSLLPQILSGVGAFLMAFREFMQVWLLRWSYVTFENVVDTLTVIVMIFVLIFQSCAYAPICSSFVVVSLALQLSFLLGALSFNNLATILYMFKTVSKNFFESFLLFTPLVGSFVYGFYLTNNVTPIDYCTDDNCSQENFNNFRSFWNATIKTLVMTTGEFEAANVDFEGGKVLLFIGFLFLAPIVILNLINGLAVSDIAAIREESKLISICKKVKQLERYERGVVKILAFRAGANASAAENNTTADENNRSHSQTESRSSAAANNATTDEKHRNQLPNASSPSASTNNSWVWKRIRILFRKPLFPGSFFEEHEPALFIVTNELNKLGIIKPRCDKKDSETSTIVNARGTNTDEHEPAPTIVTNELSELDVTEPRCDNQYFETSTKASDRNVTPKQEDSNSNTTEKDRNTHKKKNNIKPIPIFPGLPESWLEQSFKFRSYQIPLFVTLDKSYVNEAITIGEKPYPGGPADESRDSAETKQTVTSTVKNTVTIKWQKPIQSSETTTPSGPADQTLDLTDTQQTATSSSKTRTSNRRQGSPVPTTDPRDNQIKLLQEQLNNMMEMMCGIRQEMRTIRNFVCEDQQRVEDQAITDNIATGQPVDQ